MAAFYNAALQPESSKFNRGSVSRETLIAKANNVSRETRQLQEMNKRMNV
jgi:hypothetical protein